MADSDSSLSSPPSTDDEMPVQPAPAKAPKATPQKKKKKAPKKKNGTILSFFDPPSPARKKRPASPPHEYVPEDNPDIAFIVMFRSRFSDAFPPKCPHFGPQDLERGVSDPVPAPQVEGLLCALLGLVLNRKKPVEKGHYGRALEEALQTQKSQWPRSWNWVNPLSGGRSFNSMTPSERLNLLKTLALWALNQNEAVNTMIKETYKSRTTKDKNDSNIPLSVQPWGRDGDKRRYWLIEGQDDTAFRVYRESNPALKNVSWWSVAGSIEELRELAKKLEEEDGTKEAKALSERMLNAIPRFEATEAKRKRREYRINRTAAFANPNPGFSLYEGRTRGKRMKYTFSDGEEEDGSDAQSVRRSTRQPGRDTPAGPTVTASGRQVRSRATGMYGESLLSGQTTEGASPATGDYVRSEGSEEPHGAQGRSTRTSNRTSNGLHRDGNTDAYNSGDEVEDEDDATSWDGGDEDDEDDVDQMDMDEDDLGNDGYGNDAEPKSLVVCLRYGKGTSQPPADPAQTSRVTKAASSEPSKAPIAALLSGPPEPPPAQAAQAPASQLTASSVPTQQQQPPSAPSADTPNGDPNTLPKLESFFAPTPPYTAPDDATKPETQASQPFSSALPAPTSASTWQ
ncbi:hypothetical protein BS50DRAFT_584474 [Corynespora cassiicola Philippines]|uniref:WHIM1 domain-containing protein n=1 Tax=Corynespora cassiicola Philippines TaxID=1448308 RepID=A0A2T2NZV8_CORCC|nr:hypothetical protein BS50DRAFT_584474 [Corynespora cassiicola Philippines]